MSTKIVMLPIRQKQVADKIKSAGLNINDFAFDPKSNEEFSLRYKSNPQFVFQRMSTPNDENFEFCPGSNEKLKSVFKYTVFESLLFNLDLWLKALKENIEIGNPWDETEVIKQAMENIDFDSYEEIFTVEDQQKVEKGLGLLIQHFENLKIDVSQIKDDIEHLKEMSSKISKKDWMMLFLGNITNWILTGFISHENTQSVWKFLNHCFRT